MLTSTDQGHFRKYITTLGVAIVVGSLGLGGYYLQAQSDLLIDQSKLLQLTPTAREALRQKQNVLLLVADWAPFVVLGLVIVGVTMTIFGLIGWQRRQKVLDHKEDLEVNKLTVEISKMSEGEKQEQAREEALDLLSADIIGSAEAVSVDKAASATDSPSVGPFVDVMERKALQKLEGIIGRVLATRKDLAGKLSAALPGASVLAGARIEQIRADGLTWIREVDALVMPKDPANMPAWICEIKIVRTVKSVEQALTSAAAAAQIVRRSGPPPLAVVIILTEGEQELRKRILESARLMRQTFTVPPVVLVYGIDEFEALEPRALVGRIRATAKNLGLTP